LLSHHATGDREHAEAQGRSGERGHTGRVTRVHTSTPARNPW
jgi:hypothetical protein